MWNHIKRFSMRNMEMWFLSIYIFLSFVIFLSFRYHLSFSCTYTRKTNWLLPQECLCSNWIACKIPSIYLQQSFYPVRGYSELGAWMGRQSITGRHAHLPPCCREVGGNLRTKRKPTWTKGEQAQKLYADIKYHVRSGSNFGAVRKQQEATLK